MVGLGGERRHRYKGTWAGNMASLRTASRPRGPWGRITNGRHRGLSFLPEGRTWKPFHITAHSQKGDHIRVPVRVSGEVCLAQSGSCLGKPVPSSGSSAVQGEASESSPSPRTRSDAGSGGGRRGPAGTDVGGKEAAQEVPMVEKAKPR